MEIALPRVAPHARRFATWARNSAALGAVLLAILTVSTTYLLTVRSNTINAEQQQQLAALQAFISTGADVDASVTDLTDAAADKREIDATKREARHAIAGHAAAAASIEAYLVGLDRLRTLVDGSDDSVAALDASQARFDVMHNRTVIVAEARKHIY